MAVRVRGLTRRGVSRASARVLPRTAQSCMINKSRQPTAWISLCRTPLNGEKVKRLPAYAPLSVHFATFIPRSSNDCRNASQLGQTAANNVKILHASFVARCCWLNRPSVLIHADPGPVCVWTYITEGICGAVSRLRLPTKRSTSGVAVNTRTVRIGAIGLHKPASVRLLR